MKLKHVANYSKRRADQYPGVEEQLDMLWHAMDSGRIEKSEPFYSSIKEVKTRFPKPTRAEE